MPSYLKLMKGSAPFKYEGLFTHPLLDVKPSLKVIDTMTKKALGLDDIAIGVIALAVGFFMTFFGRRMLKPLIFIMGSIFGAIIGWMSLPELIYSFIPMKESTMTYVQLSSMVLMSLLGGLLGYFFWKAAVFVSGGLGGFLSGGWLCTLLPTGFIEGYINRRAFLTLLTVIGGLASTLVEAYIVIGTSILMGAFIMIYGIDKFLRLGFAEHVQHMIDYETISLERLSPTGWGLVAAGVVFAFVGLVAQCHQYQNKK